MLQSKSHSNDCFLNKTCPKPSHLTLSLLRQWAFQLQKQPGFWNIWNYPVLSKEKYSSGLATLELIVLMSLWTSYPLLNSCSKVFSKESSDLFKNLLLCSPVAFCGIKSIFCPIMNPQDIINDLIVGLHNSECWSSNIVCCLQGNVFSEHLVSFGCTEAVGPIHGWQSAQLDKSHGLWNKMFLCLVASSKTIQCLSVLNPMMSFFSKPIQNDALGETSE